jgi:hypothetical protein
MLGNLIGGFIVILVGSVLAPVVALQVYNSTITNSSGSLDLNTSHTFAMNSTAITIIGLTTLFYNLAIAATAIGIAAQGLRNSGLM